MARGYPDFEGDKSGLYLKAEWAAYEAVDKDFYGTGIISPGNSLDVDYTVPADKTLYITSFEVAAFASIDEDKDLPQMCIAWLWDLDAPVIKALAGGSGGGNVVLSKPSVFSANTNIRFRASSGAIHVMFMYIAAHGYEV